MSQNLSLALLLVEAKERAARRGAKALATWEAAYRQARETQGVAASVSLANLAVDDLLLTMRQK